MSLEAFTRALEELDEPTCIDGTVALGKRLAVMLPGGDAAAVDDPCFIDWLLEHGEPAPFGHEGETRLDPAVRHAVRLRARGAAAISGFDPALVLDAIEAALSPRRHLTATLTDVLVYPKGGHFARHKDTPRTPDLVGTLVVGLPITHTGGAFHVDEVAGVRVFDWGGPVDRNCVRWVAVFSDVDHEIKPVESGARVTLVYALTLSDRPRSDAALDARHAALRDAARQLAMPAEGPLMIACTRQVIGGDEPLQAIESLRGADREIADALIDAGCTVRVRTCLVARSSEFDGKGEPPRFRTDMSDSGDIAFARLSQPFTDADVARLLQATSFVSPWGDGGGYSDDEATNLSPYLVGEVGFGNWIIRKSAAATFLCATEFAFYGYVGNDAVESYLYKLAALEVTRARE